MRIEFGVIAHSESSQRDMWSRFQNLLDSLKGVGEFSMAPGAPYLTMAAEELQGLGLCMVF